MVTTIHLARDNDHRFRNGLWAAILVAAVGCGNSDPDDNPGDANGTDRGDTANESGTASTSDELPGDASVSDDRVACLSSVSGRVLQDGASGIPAVIVVCLGPTLCLAAVPTEADGSFTWDYPGDEEPCVTEDFNDTWLHFEVMAYENPELYAGYAFVRRPTQADVSDLGESDFDLDLGDLALYRLPPSSVTYTPGQAASVDTGDIAFEVPADGLVKRPLGDEQDVPLENPQPIRVFEAPLSEWSPPFVETPPDALYYLAPRWAKLAAPGVALSIAPPAGWRDGNTGTMRLLGRLATDFEADEGLDASEHIYRDDNGICINTDDDSTVEQVEDGFLEPCGPVEMVDGRIVTPPIPRFTWVAIYGDQ